MSKTPDNHALSQEDCTQTVISLNALGQKVLTHKWLMFFIIFTLAFTLMAKFMFDVGVIRIVPTGKKNTDSNGSGVRVSAIVKNNHETYDLYRIMPDGWSAVGGENIESDKNSNKPLELRTRRYDSLQVTFCGGPDMGKVSIQTPGGSFLVDLYVPEEEDDVRVDIPFAVAEAFPFSKSLAIGAALAAALTAICYFLSNRASPGMIALVSCMTGYAGAILLILGGVELGKRTDACFIAAYGFFAELAIPRLIKERRVKPVGKVVFLAILSAYAAIALLYRFLVKPYSSFHFGIYGLIQFALAFTFWYFFFYVVITFAEGLINSERKTTSDMRGDICMGRMIAVLIPCYNESATIAKVVSDFRRELPEADIYVYDNNSTDGTADIARKAGAIVKREPKQGKGNVLRSMFREINADCYLLVDGDDTYPAECARELCDQVLDHGMDMVVGDRLSATYFTENKRQFHNFGNRLVRGSVNFFFKGHVHDIMSGYRAFSTRFVKSFPVLSAGFEIETEMTIHALDKNMNISEIPVQYRDRPQGSVSKLNTIPDGLKVLFTIFRFYKDYRPLPFFSILALLLFLCTGIIAGPILYEFFTIGYTSHMAKLTLSGFIMIAGMLSFGCGLILDTMMKKAKQDFEIYMNMIEIGLDSQKKKEEAAGQ